MKRAAILILDGVGVGGAPDAADYGDAGSDTLGNVARALGGLSLPNLERRGLGNIRDIPGLRRRGDAAGAWGSLRPASAGKDSTTGHWEIAGVHLERAFPTYPRGFPDAVIASFAKATGRAVIANEVASGTDIVNRFGEEHQKTGSWIVYTSADSVFQIAAHEATVPLDELYRACGIAREMLRPPHDVSRVIARPFAGVPGAYARTSNRRDYSLSPPSETLLDALEKERIPRAGVGKVDDLFAGRGIAAKHTASNAEGIREIKEWLSHAESGLLFANLVDFDQMYGHRNDVAGFNEALREFDAALPSLTTRLKEDDLLFITADHGNDPTTPSTDHTRECVPLLVSGQRVVPGNLGERETFSDLGATVAEWFGLSFRGRGKSFLSELVV
ncbi:MAG TPA: phosphopentomutase [Gemmatimonadaceae bacterium]|nr:phosphopentomutase [Gemmatimonadaceae bacterium]